MTHGLCMIGIAGIILMLLTATSLLRVFLGRGGDDIVDGDAILVFAAGVWPDGPSPTLSARIDRATELYHEGRAPRILCSGGISRDISEAAVMREMLVAKGVPAECIIQDDGGETTRKAIQSAKAFAVNRWKTILAVSSPYHLHRVRAEGRRQGLTLRAFPSGPASETPGARMYNARQYVRESFAAVWYAFSWYTARILYLPPGCFSPLRAMNHVTARLGYLFGQADAVAGASEAIGYEIKRRIAGFSDTTTVLTPASGLHIPADGALGSRFGLRHRRLHAGIDIRARYGTPVTAAAAGTVILRKPYGPYGNILVVNHGGGLATVYAHLCGFCVNEGDSVHASQLVGYIGQTGRSFGPHLHFEVRVHGSPVDPLVYLPFERFAAM